VGIGEKPKFFRLPVKASGVGFDALIEPAPEDTEVVAFATPASSALCAPTILLKEVTFGPMLPVFGKSTLTSVPGAAVKNAVKSLIFAGTGLASLVQNASFLDYGELPLAPEASMRRSMGILVIEIGVTLAVAGAVLAIFHALYRDEPEDDR